MINDLKVSNFDVKISIFADDIAIWFSGRNVENCVKTLQKSLDEIIKWCKKWGFKLSISKSKAIIFSNKQPKGEIKKLKLEDNTLDYVIM